ncbi:2TM domain-containing protein [Kribbella sp. NPDC005582]|uniref:2TM domain-containing protein n=1 Tax=Kribbella sp. NPDC005582 TaxID=3156893 RepID=UPI00339F6134
MLLAVIAACEIGFWVLLAAGMATRYLFRLPRVGMVLLMMVPLVDVVMLVASVIDIHRGGEPSFKHSLAAIFIGVSVGFGHQTLKWADGWAAYRFAGAPRPVKPPKRGRERARRERAGWFRHLLAYVVGVGIMIALGLLSGKGYDAALGPAWGWTVVLVIDAIVSFSYSFDGDSADDAAPKTKQVA